jgi:hypothetical protein
MPPDKDCPVCQQRVQDWHFEWYDKSEQSTIYRGLAAMDCPLCGELVGYQQTTIGPAPVGIPVVKRRSAKAAEWANSQALHAGGTLQGYVSTPGAGAQYAGYWPAQEILQADADEAAKNQGP